MRKAWGSLGLALLVFAAGCGGDESRQLATPQTLAIMVVPPAELGVSHRFRAHRDSGPVSNAEVATVSKDRHDTATSVAAKGRTGGYALAYVTPAVGRARAQNGVLYVGTGVDAYRDVSYASQAMHLAAEHFSASRGAFAAGVKLVRSSTFDVTGVGDEAEGVRERMWLGKRRLALTVVTFRHDEIVGWAGYVRADSRNAEDDAVALARTLEGRVTGVLAGEIDEERVALPKSVLAEKSPIPVSGPDARRATLHAADVPGASVASEKRQAKGGAVTFVRELRASRLGFSRISYLRAMTQVLPTPDEAGDAFVYYSTPDGARAVADVFIRRVAKLKPRNVFAAPMPIYADDTAGVEIRYDSPRGRLVTAIVVVRRGTAIGSLTATGFGNELDPSDVTPYARAIRARLKAAGRK